MAPLLRYHSLVSLRVLHVVASMATGDGGPVECVRQLVRFLPQAGVHTTLVTTDRRLVSGDELSNVGRVSVARARWPARYNFAPSLSALVRAELRQCDVMHVHAVNNFPTSTAVRIARRHGIPFVLQPHGAYDDYHIQQNGLVKALYHRAVDARAFDSAAAVVASSSREASGILSSLGREPVVIPLGVDPLLLTATRHSRQSGRILFLGRVTEKKSVDLVIEAFAMSDLARKGIRLTIAGPVDARLRYDPSEIVRDYELQGAVDVIGSVDATMRMQLLASSDIFVLPSKDESFGVSVAEAMAAGCAVMASPQVGIAPAAAAEGALRMVDRDGKSWAEALVEMYSEPEKMQAMGSRARLRASIEYDWGTIAARFAVLYGSVAD